MTNPISLDPAAPIQGKSLRICYDFAEGEPGLTLELDWNPDGLQPTTLDLTPDEPCKVITVPNTAESMVAASEDHLLAVQFGAGG